MKIQTLLKKEFLALKKIVLAYFTVTAGTLLLQLLVPYVSGSYIDSLVGKHPAILLFVGAIAFLNIFSILAGYGMTYFITKLNNTFLYRVCSQMFQKVYAASLSYFQNQDAAFLTDQITGDAATISEFILNNIPDFVYNILLLTISAVFVLQADFVLGFLILVTIPLYFLIYKKLRSRMYKNEQEYKEAGNDYTSKGMEQIRCTRFVKENEVPKEMKKRLEAAFQRMLKSAVGQVKTQYLFSNLNRLIMVFCYLFVLGIGGHNVVTGKITIGYFTIINSYVNLILSAAADVIDFSGNYPKVKVAVDRMNIILAKCSPISKDDSPKKLMEVPAVDSVILENISFSYERKSLFHNLSAKFQKGKIYAITGDNGVGKSTLLDIMIGLYPEEYEGSIYYNGINIKNIDTSRLREKSISFVGQQAEPINIAPKEYLHFGIKEYDPAKENELIKFFLLDQDTNINQEENIIHCSGGEMQKLSLIRAMQKNCVLTILDEPTNGLDTETVQRLIWLLTSQKENHIFIIVSHDKRILDMCDVEVRLG